MKKVKATRTEKLPPTTKKQKFIGFKEFIDAETGEVIPMQLNQVEDRDFNFTKVWLRTFIEGLDGIANKRMKLAFWIIDNLNKENQFIGTFKKMADETGLSEYTVIMTMRELQKGNPPFLKKLQSGVYQVNPDILYKGSHKSRMGIIYQFGSVASKDALEKKKAFNEQEEQVKAKKTEAATDTSTESTETTVADTESTSTASTTATESVNHRTGRAGRSKPLNWAEIKAKILSGEITRKKYCKDNHISPNTLKRWLAKSD